MPEPERMREPWLGTAAPGSARAVIAIAILLVTFVAVFALPLYQVVELAVTRQAPEEVEVTFEGLVTVLVFSLLVFVGATCLVLSVTYAGEEGAIVRRLRLGLTKYTHLHVLLGAGLTVAVMIVLGAILYGLSEAGIYDSEESALIPQIQAILTWPLVFILPAVAAFSEEVFFRGFLQPRAGLVASSLLFGLVHIGYGTVLQVVAPVVLGLFFGVLFARTRSLWTPIAAHFTFDFVELAALMAAK